MKKKKPVTRFQSRLLAFGLMAAMVFSMPTLASEDPIEDKPAKKSKFRLKSFTSLNNRTVKIFPDIIKREMHVIAKENRKPIDFFVFDVEGTLLHHYKMKDGEHYKIAGLARGLYVYRVFCGDEETAAGDFQIR